MKTLKLTLQIVGDKHVIVAGAGDEHVCKADDAEDIGKAVLSVIEAAKTAPEEEPQRVNADRPPSNGGSNGSSDDGEGLTFIGALGQIFASQEARDIGNELLNIGERFSVKDPSKS